MLVYVSFQSEQYRAPPGEALLDAPPDHPGPVGPDVPRARLPHLAKLFPTTTTCGGVTLYQDWRKENYWLQVDRDHEGLALVGMLEVIDRLGLEMMDDQECEPFVFANGSVRHYLVEKEVVG